MDLCSLSNVRKMLADNSLSPRKSLGQNFLVNPGVPEMIAEKSAMLARRDINSDAPIGVIEIGPGIGALTERLSQYYDRVVALEIDRGIASLFEKNFSRYENVKLILGDVMKTDIHALISENLADIMSAGGTVSVCANLPYYITTPVIMRILESFDPTEKLPLSSVTVMIQSEVADRLTAKAGTSEYGSITASVSLRGNTIKNFDVSPGSFYPPPKVKSTVISIIPHGGIREICPDFSGNNEELRFFFHKVSKVIEAAFAQRRKTLTNALSGLYSKEDVVSALEIIGKSTDIRGERLQASDYCALVNQLIKTEKVNDGRSS